MHLVYRHHPGILTYRKVRIFGEQWFPNYVRLQHTGLRKLLSRRMWNMTPPWRRRSLAMWTLAGLGLTTKLLWALYQASSYHTNKQICAVIWSEIPFFFTQKIWRYTSSSLAAHHYAGAHHLKNYVSQDSSKSVSISWTEYWFCFLSYVVLTCQHYQSLICTEPDKAKTKVLLMWGHSV